MKHTTDINWVGNYVKPDPVADGYTLVYEGDITFTAARFSDFIPLDTDFSYNGVDNLIITGMEITLLDSQDGIIQDHLMHQTV